MGSFYVERALFIVGDPNTGKSVQIRSMFRDIRLSGDGQVPLSVETHRAPWFVHAICRAY